MTDNRLVHLLSNDIKNKMILFLLILLLHIPAGLSKRERGMCDVEVFGVLVDEMLVADV